MKKVIPILFLLSLFALPEANAQRWKKYRHEVYGGIGASGFLGEVGGGNGAARDLFLDLDGKASRYCLTAGYRYKLYEAVSVRGMLTGGQINGSDNLAGDIWRKSRNLSFRSPIVELAGVGELYFIREKIGSRYKVRGIKGVFGNNFSAYLFGGLGGFFFSPSAKFVGNATYPGDNKWYGLRKLGTEGQGFNGNKRYLPMSVAIPLGIGAKFNINRNYALSLEVGYRYTFTDYIDDVSTVYSDPADLIANNGASGNAAAWFGNPAIPQTKPNGEIIIAGAGNYTGGQRGDPTTNDTYLFATLCLNYKFISKKTNRPKF